MGSVYEKKGWLYLQFKDHRGEWVQKAAKLPAGREEDARKLLRKVEERIAAQVDAGFGDGPLVVRKYGEQWIEGRKQDNIADWKNEESRLKNHVYPEIGDMLLTDVRPRHIISMIRKCRNSGDPAPKTIRNIYGVTAMLFRDARIAELIDQSPCILTKAQLGPNEDKDPEWRATAIYTREELQSLTADLRVPTDRQLLYGLEGIAGLRHGEAAGLRWRNYKAREPLRELQIATSYDKGRTKTKRTRWMPVHPTLASMLDVWRQQGWVEMMGRAPADDDLIVPMPPEHRERRRSAADEEGMRNKNYSRKRLLEDLKALGLRPRRGHDLRATMITLAQDDGARGDILERCTHNPAKKERAFDGYTRFQWETLCTEVAKLRIDQKVKNQEEGAEPSKDSAAGNPQAVLPDYYPENFMSTINKMLVEAPGIEPGSENLQ